MPENLGDPDPSLEETPDPRPLLLRTTAPLWTVFSGGLICLIDLRLELTFSDRRLRFDLLDDLVGMLLITWGVFRLGTLKVPGSYGRMMVPVEVMAVLSAVEALIEHFTFEPPPAVNLLWTAFDVAKTGAVIAFFAAMRLFCAALRCREAAASWRTTMWNFVVLFGIPLVILHGATALAILGITSSGLDLGPNGQPLMAVLTFPMIHFGISNFRTRRAADKD